MTTATKSAIAINLDDLERLMNEYIEAAWDGEELTMPLTLSGLLLWLRKQQSEDNDEQKATTTHN